jgi:hypothetical protein
MTFGLAVLSNSRLLMSNARHHRFIVEVAFDVDELQLESDT